MNKIIFLIYLIPLSTMSIAQLTSGDTTFYNQGVIKNIKYKIGERFESQIRYFKKSFNDLDKNQPLVDTIFSNGYAGKKDWIHYDGSIRLFLHKNSNVWIGKSTKYGYNKDDAFYKLKGSYDFLFRELGDLRLMLSYSDDTTITFLSLETIDTSRMGDHTKELFFLNRYNFPKGIKMNEGEFNYIYKCGNLGTVELIFSQNNLLNRFFFYPKNIENPATVYEFYDNFSCKIYGHYIGKTPVGKWYEYHENGNIKSIGDYEIFNNGFRKNGLWQYFEKDGKLTKTENWINGQIIVPEKKKVK